MTEPVFNKIAIIGAGLIGASIARAAVQYGAAGTVSLYDSSEDVRLRAAGIALGMSRTILPLLWQRQIACSSVSPSVPCRPLLRTLCR